jgi:hypothetical protein
MKSMYVSQVLPFADSLVSKIEFAAKLPRERVFHRFNLGETPL